jgi:hypothetical protein
MRGPGGKSGSSPSPNEELFTLCTCLTASLPREMVYQRSSAPSFTDFLLQDPPACGGRLRDRHGRPTTTSILLAGPTVFFDSMSCGQCRPTSMIRLSGHDAPESIDGSSTLTSTASCSIQSRAAPTVLELRRPPNPVSFRVEQKGDITPISVDKYFGTRILNAGLLCRLADWPISRGDELE